VRAAFFDLDRTVIARSSSLALAGAFRRRGLIGRRQLLRAGLAQLHFSLLGVGEEAGRELAERGMRVLTGVSVLEVRKLVSDAIEPALRPLVYRGALELVQRHRARGDRVYLVSAALDEVVEQLAAELRFDGSLGSSCIVENGIYTGRPGSLCYGAEKALALTRLAAVEGLELARSAAYSDRATDLPFLEAVGCPVAVNPDRQLRLIARERAWPVVRLRVRAFA
jgi:HAD superfamily hydrolase (TIGR01490 family)